VDEQRGLAAAGRRRDEQVPRPLAGQPLVQRLDLGVSAAEGNRILVAAEIGREKPLDAGLKCDRRG